MTRDRLAEIADLRSRGLPHLSKGIEEFENLCEWWKTENKVIGNSSDHLLIKTVTIIEVFTRSFVRELIDKGEGYADKTIFLIKKNEFKLDFAVAQALQSKQCTLGQLVSHSLTFGNVESIYSNLEILIGNDIIIKNNHIIDNLDKNKKYLKMTKIKDMAALRKAIARLFKIRNIMVHELPEERPYNISEINDLTDHAGIFINVMSQVAMALLYPRYLEVRSEQAAREADIKQIEETEAELEKTVMSVHKKGDDAAFQDAQDAWKDYRSKYSTYIASRHKTIRHSFMKDVFYQIEFRRLTSLRINELRDLQ